MSQSKFVCCFQPLKSIFRTYHEQWRETMVKLGQRLEMEVEPEPAFKPEVL